MYIIMDTGSAEESNANDTQTHRKYTDSDHKDRMKVCFYTLKSTILMLLMVIMKTAGCLQL